MTINIDTNYLAQILMRKVGVPESPRTTSKGKGSRNSRKKGSMVMGRPEPGTPTAGDMSSRRGEQFSVVEGGMTLFQRLLTEEAYLNLQAWFESHAEMLPRALFSAATVAPFTSSPSLTPAAAAGDEPAAHDAVNLSDSVGDQLTKPRAASSSEAAAALSSSSSHAPPLLSTSNSLSSSTSSQNPSTAQPPSPRLSSSGSAPTALASLPNLASSSPPSPSLSSITAAAAASSSSSSSPQSTSASKLPVSGSYPPSADNTTALDFVAGYEPRMNEYQFLSVMRQLSSFKDYEIFNIFDIFDQLDTGSIGFSEMHLLISLYAAKESAQLTQVLFLYGRQIFDRFSLGQQKMTFQQFYKLAAVLGISHELLVDQVRDLGIDVFDLISYDDFMLHYFAILDILDAGNAKKIEQAPSRDAAAKLTKSHSTHRSFSIKNMRMSTKI